MVPKKKYHAFGTQCSLSRRLELFLELGGAVERKRKKYVAIFLQLDNIWIDPQNCLQQKTKTKLLN
jgi:hypothetical protein